MDDRVSSRLETEVIHFLRSSGLRAGDRVLVACSGGADSTALAVLLNRASLPLGFSLTVAHYNHNLRTSAEARSERSAVFVLARQLGLRVEEGAAGSSEIRDLARQSGRGVEAAARSARYAFLAQTANRLQARWVALAHTQDDQLETVLMRLLSGRGASVTLQGIPAMRESESKAWSFTYLRPLLGSRREDVRAVSVESGAQTVEDPSNSDNRFLRARVRNALVPVLDEQFPRWRSGLRGVLARQELLGSGVRAASEKVVWHRDGEAIRTDTDSLLHLEPAARVEAVKRAAHEIGVPAPTVRSLLPLIWAPAAEALPRSIDAAGLAITCTRASIALSLPVGDTPGWSSGWYRRDPSNAETSPRWSNVVHLERRMVIARSRRPGDVIRLGSHQRMVKKLLQEMDIPASGRDLVPILEDDEGVVAVIGSVAGGADLVADRCLKYQADREIG